MNVPPRGELKEVIDIINVTKPYGVNGSGTLVSTHASDILAKIEPLGGGLKAEAETQEEQAFAQTYFVWIAYIEDVTVFQQITWGDKRLYQTAPPEKFNNGRMLLLHAEECITREL